MGRDQAIQIATEKNACTCAASSSFFIASSLNYALKKRQHLENKLGKATSAFARKHG